MSSSEQDNQSRQQDSTELDKYGDFPEESFFNSVGWGWILLLLLLLLGFIGAVIVSVEHFSLASIAVAFLSILLLGILLGSSLIEKQL